MLFVYTYSFFLQEANPPYKIKSSNLTFCKFYFLNFNLKCLIKLSNNNDFHLSNHFLFFNESTRVNVVLINTTEIHDA